MTDADALKSQLDAQQRRISELEKEVAESNGDGAATKKQRGPRRHRARGVFAALLIVLGTILTPITILALFVHTEVTDTGRYVQNVAPLATNPAVQAYVATDISNRLFAQVDIAAYVKDALPPRAEPLAGPLTSALKSFVHETTLRVLQSKQFAQLWKEVNRVAHTQLVNVITGRKGGAVTATSNGEVSIDLHVVAQQVQQRLEASGLDIFSRIPIARIGGKIPIFQSKDLYKVRRAVSVLDTLAWLLPILVLASFVGAILLARDRRHMFLWAAIGFTIGGLILAIALTIGRNIYLNAATSRDLPYDAAAAVFDTLIRYLHTSVRAVLTFSAVVVIAVFFAGPSRLANWFRYRARMAVGWLGKETDRAGWTWLGPVPLVVQHKGAWRTATAVIAFVVLFRWNRPTPAVIFWAAIIVLFVLAVIEFLGREPLPAPAVASSGERSPAPVGSPTVTSAG